MMKKITLGLIIIILLVLCNYYAVNAANDSQENNNNVTRISVLLEDCSDAKKVEGEIRFDSDFIEFIGTEENADWNINVNEDDMTFTATLKNNLYSKNQDELIFKFKTIRDEDIEKYIDKIKTEFRIYNLEMTKNDNTVIELDDVIMVYVNPIKHPIEGIEQPVQKDSEEADVQPEKINEEQEVYIPYEEDYSNNRK